jgi:hypothetical protein
MTKQAAAEPYLPFLESNGWKTCTIIMLVYCGWKVLNILMGWINFGESTVADLRCKPRIELLRPTTKVEDHGQLYQVGLMELVLRCAKNLPEKDSTSACCQEPNLKSTLSWKRSKKNAQTSKQCLLSLILELYTRLKIIKNRSLIS